MTENETADVAATEMCACGQPLHYPNATVQEIITGVVDRMGPFLNIETPKGVWEVPRHFAALHGVKANELPALAAKYGFKQVSGRTDAASIGVLPEGDGALPSAEEESSSNVAVAKSPMRSLLPGLPQIPCLFCGQPIDGLGFFDHFLAEGVFALAFLAAANAPEEQLDTFRSELEAVEDRVKETLEKSALPVARDLQRVLQNRKNLRLDIFAEVAHLFRAQTVKPVAVEQKDVPVPDGAVVVEDNDIDAVLMGDALSRFRESRPYGRRLVVPEVLPTDDDGVDEPAGAELDALLIGDLFSVCEEGPEVPAHLLPMPVRT